jgi:hypothetical protein
LRNLSDSEFESAVPILAKELELFDYSIHYSDEVLLNDWNVLQHFSSKTNSINSTTRVGMKILEHFNQNIWGVRGSKCNSFASEWKANNLEKVLRWNRKSHSTPYISELRRGLYFCGFLNNKVTMYRPTLAKIICDRYNPVVVLDPCAGWGGRMLGSVASGCHYIGIEPCVETYNNLVAMANFLGITNKVTLHNCGAEDITISGTGLLLTSPPYFDLELYDNSISQSVVKYSTYTSWSASFLRSIVRMNTGISCFNVANYGKYDIIGDVIKYHKELGMVKTNEFCVTSSARQTAGLGKKADITYCFEKEVK